MWLLIVDKTGNKSIAEAMNNISIDEFHVWRALFKSHPWGYEIENLRTDMIINTIAAIAGGKGDPLFIDDLVKESVDPEKSREEKLIKFIKQMGEIKGNG